MDKKKRDTLEAFEMWCWGISWTEKRTNYDVLKTVEKKTIIDRHRNEKEMVDDRTHTHTLRHGDELHSLIVEGTIKGRRPSDLEQSTSAELTKDAGVTFYRELKDMANDREKRRRRLSRMHF